MPIVLKIEQYSFRTVEVKFDSIEEVAAFIGSYGMAFVRADRGTEFRFTLGGGSDEDTSEVSEDTTDVKRSEE